MEYETIKISQLPQASSSISTDRFPIAQGANTKSIEPGLLATDWHALGVTPTVVSSAGQKEHVIRFASVDYSGVIPVGGKFRIPRTGTVPTTSMAFVAASSQYASKTSPTGITFTDDFTCEAWVYLDSYPSGTDAEIISRFDNTNGFYYDVISSGQVRLVGTNASGVNFRFVQTYQSVPLGKWVHIAATLDMSGFTTATCKAYIDGVDVPAVLTAGGTSPTALIQAGNLQIGAASGTRYINGRIANARIWSTLRTAAQIRDNMNQETPASTTGLVAHFKGNGSWNDSSANANNLTASGGAVNNYAAHPYSATEYAIATKVQYTGGNTDVTIFTGSGCLPNETLGATSYSTARAPYGFPASKAKWRVTFINRTSTTQGSPVQNTWYNVGNAQLLVPSGAWIIQYMASSYASRGSAGSCGIFSTLSTSVSAESDIDMTVQIYSASVSEILGLAARNRELVLTTPTSYYLVSRTDVTGIASLTNFGNTATTRIEAECAYL